jgi:hypothetical protein
LASLATRIGDLITAIGADIKALQNRVTNQYNASTAVQTGFAADTYLSGSMISIPQGKVKVGTKYKCKFNVVKTAAGVAAPVITVRVGTAGTVADTARTTLTYAAQTAAIDEGEIEVECVVRATGAGATTIIQAIGSLIHRLATTGLNVTAAFTSVKNTGAAFDITGANLKIGLSVNAGASAAWTIDLVSTELVNLTP